LEVAEQRRVDCIQRWENICYLKTNTYVNVAEINGVGLNDEAQDTIRKVRDAGHNFWIDPHSISLDFICWYFIEDADGFFMN
jgi:hypothetical protein